MLLSKKTAAIDSSILKAFDSISNDLIIGKIGA